MPDATFAHPDLTTFARLDSLGLKVTGQVVDPDRAVLACGVVDPDQGVSDSLCRWLGVTPRTWSVELGVSRHE